MAQKSSVPAYDAVVPDVSKHHFASIFNGQQSTKDGPLNRWKLKHYNLGNVRKHSVTSQKTWILSSHIIDQLPLRLRQHVGTYYQTSRRHISQSPPWQPGNSQLINHNASRSFNTRGYTSADSQTISADMNSRQFSWAVYHIIRLPEATLGVPFMLATRQGNSWRSFDLPFRIIWTSVLLPNNNPLLSSATPSYDKRSRTKSGNSLLS
jgi:hypothetical protein